MTGGRSGVETLIAQNDGPERPTEGAWGRGWRGNGPSQSRQPPRPLLRPAAAGRLQRGTAGRAWAPGGLVLPPRGTAQGSHLSLPASQRKPAWRPDRVGCGRLTLGAGPPDQVGQLGAGHDRLVPTLPCLMSVTGMLILEAPAATAGISGADNGGGPNGARDSTPPPTKNSPAPDAGGAEAGKSCPMIRHRRVARWLK